MRSMDVAVAGSTSGGRIGQKTTIKRRATHAEQKIRCQPKCEPPKTIKWMDTGPTTGELWQPCTRIIELGLLLASNGGYL